MRALERKLWRDLWRLRGQALAIALVIASGVATYVISVSTLDSLRATQASFYRDYGFPDVFASLKRAPESMAGRIREIPGVDRAETRVVSPARLEVGTFREPIRALLVSIPDDGDPVLNRLFLRAGRRVDPRRDDEVMVGEAFAEGHGLRPGDGLAAIVNGRRSRLTVVGIVLSPEHVFQVGPGMVFPDSRRYGVLWMARTPLEAGAGLDGAFNDVTLALAPGADRRAVIERLDALLAPYGGRGACGREDQVSHKYLSEEFRQLGTMAAVFPVIFLGVAAFLLNIVVGRQVGLQREQIAVLKAFGYGNADIGLHYLGLVGLIVAGGVAAGLGAGAWLAHGLGNIYMRYYRFPYLEYLLRPSVAFTAAAVSAGAAFLGTLFSVGRAARLPPAEAMRAEPPATYRETLAERMGLKRVLSQPGRMIARHIGRRPVKSLLTVAGISMACAILMVGRFQEDAIEFMVDAQFRQSQREDISVSFVEPVSRKALHELRSLDGVGRVEVCRSVPVRLRFGHRSYRTEVLGLEAGGTLQRLLDAAARPIVLPPTGIVLTDRLGKVLGVRTGELLTVEALEGKRAVRDLPVRALVGQYFGMSAFMDLDSLNRFLREGDAISGAYLAADTSRWSGIFRELDGRPRVGGTVVRTDAIRNFYATMGDTLLIFTLVNTFLAGTIAFGVVYNSMRIALSERSRELASLRVLGYSRAEAAYILLGELAALTLAAIPPGFLIGWGLCAFMADLLKSDLYRIPLVLTPRTFAFSATVILGATLVSALAVRSRLNRLDLVAVLKTKE